MIVFVMRCFRNLPLTVKLGGAFGLIVCLSTLMSYVGSEGATRMARYNTAAQALFAHDLMGISSIKEAAIFQVKSSRVQRDMVLASGDKDTLSDLKQTLDEFQASVLENLSAAQSSFEDASSKQKIDEIHMLIPQFNQSSDRLYAAAIAGDLATEKQSLQEANGAANAINLAIAETCRMREEAAKQSHVEAETTFKKLRAATVSLATAVLLAGIGCGIFTIRLVTRPLRAMMEVLAAAANGDLTKRLSADTHDELGRMAAALNEALESTRMALIEVNVTASALSGASRDLTEAASMLESGSRDQARELESTTAQLGEIGRTATQTAGNATRATLLASGSNGHGEGASSAENAVAAMAEINVASSKIAGIIGVVDVIAFQTGLLSLNASVEAAHAGEGGRGFAVVAQEVRNLAQRSAGSATEIKSLIEDSKVKVGRGSALVGRITRLIEQIASASEEQRAGIGLVNGAMVNMDRITKGNSVQAASLAATAKSLASQAFHLQEMIARFELQERPLDWAS